MTVVHFDQFLSHEVERDINRARLRTGALGKLNPFDARQGVLFAGPQASFAYGGTHVHQTDSTVFE